MKIKRACEVCGTSYDANTLDIARGWGLCCSKACAAKKREDSKRAKGLIVGPKVPELDAARSFWDHIKEPPRIEFLNLHEGERTESSLKLFMSHQCQLQMEHRETYEDLHDKLAKIVAGEVLAARQYPGGIGVLCDPAPTHVPFSPFMDMERSRVSSNLLDASRSIERLLVSGDIRMTPGRDSTVMPVLDQFFRAIAEAIGSGIEFKRGEVKP